MRNYVKNLMNNRDTSKREIVTLLSLTDNNNNGIFISKIRNVLRHYTSWSVELLEFIGVNASRANEDGNKLSIFSIVHL